MIDYPPPKRWIWQQPDWPAFRWRDEAVLPLVRATHKQLGILVGRMGSVGAELNASAALDTLLQNIITSSQIEGETLNATSVRSSLARRLGVTVDEEILNYPRSARTEGLATLMMDAISNIMEPLSLERLLQWHTWLFPDDEPRLISLRVGQLRGDDPMQVVSGRIDKPKIHFEAPARAELDEQLAHFIAWFNQQNATTDPLLRAAIAHFWLITLHPFDDGNGRITRALTDLALAQADAQTIRLYAMSNAILENRNDYYRVLEQSQRGDLDITEWLSWFLLTLNSSVQMALATIDLMLQKRRFWQQFHHENFLPEQRKVLNRLLDGGERSFQGGISATQYQKVAKVSKATATRHLSDLLNKGCLQKLPGGGRSTRYCIAP